MVSTLAQKLRGVGSNPAVGAIFPISYTPMTLVVVAWIPYILCIAFTLAYFVYVCRSALLACM